MQLWLVGFLALPKGFSVIAILPYSAFPDYMDSLGTAMFSRLSQYFIH